MLFHTTEQLLAQRSLVQSHFDYKVLKIIKYMNKMPNAENI